VFSNLTAGGDLKISQTVSDTTPLRISIGYCYTNMYGPTVTSDMFTFYVNMPMVEWSSRAYLRIQGPKAVNVGNTGVQLFYLEENQTEPSFLGRVDYSASTLASNWSFVCTGYLYDSAALLVSNLEAPKENYTEGVKASKMTAHDNRLYFWGSSTKPDRLWMGGGIGNQLSVSTGTGGGYADVEPGSGHEIRVVTKYKTQSGNDIVTLLCDNRNSGKESRHNLIENNITLSNEQSVQGWHTEKVNNTVGCKSFYGAGVWADGLYAISRYGLALTTMTMEYNSQIRTQYVSSAIEPVFLDLPGEKLSHSVLFCINDVIYLTIGEDEGNLDNVIFCYDIDMKAWWSYSLVVDTPILNMIPIDYEGNQEGIGIICRDCIYFLPTTELMKPSDVTDHDLLIETGELNSATPMTLMTHLTQVEFRFDHFIGKMRIELVALDQFGRRISLVKNISHDTLVHDLSEYIRVDLKVRKWKLIFTGRAHFRLTHWIAKQYPLSSRTGIVWGFDSSESYRTNGDIHRYFKDYNDIRKAIVP
jgi:hypothetical protein